MLDRKEMKMQAKENIRMQLGTMILIYLLATIVISIASAIPFGTLVVLGPISFGLMYVFWLNSEGQNVEIPDLFEGFKSCFGESFLAGLFVQLFVLLWSLLFIIPGIVKSYSYSMTFYLMSQHPELKAKEAIDMSKEMTKGHKMDLFVLDLSFIGWFLLSVLTCGILLLWVLPYVQSTKIQYYRSLEEFAEN